MKVILYDFLMDLTIRSVSKSYLFMNPIFFGFPIMKSDFLSHYDGAYKLNHCK